MNNQIVMASKEGDFSLYTTVYYCRSRLEETKGHVLECQSLGTIMTYQLLKQILKPKLDFLYEFV